MIYGFGTYRLDTDRLELWRGGESVSVEPQVFRLLQLLIENRGRVVSKDELIAQVWGGRIVSDATLNSRINVARRAVGDDGKSQAVVRTMARRGFRFVADVTEAAEAHHVQTTARQLEQFRPAKEPEVPQSAPSALSTPAGDSERKQVTVLCAGFKGSDELVGALDPEAALSEIDPALRAMVQAIARYGGTVSDRRNDGMLALFGASRAQEDHAVDLRTVRRM